ncbi:tRNA pseudouridine(13) synthase TruD [Crenothrix polyspora]|uniref:tRNA pseudouridine synthase D n=1 Tax=Crenothrix polyspora TaxID=360316 RepID=A0A1R4HAT1_9GAMM|nr:tRNA pseudouridine(13) synthase TruD [Crenothrix polyspora]SJM93372.1 tRNA pseudouridine synthase D [Crenothrix polyspora]
MNIDLPLWPCIYGSPFATGSIRSRPEDFIVIENLSFEPSGNGEHAFLRIEKTGENTEFIARQLAKFAGVRQRDIGYAGLKDRHAVTTQWFSVWLPGKVDPDWTQLHSDNINVLHVIRHARKLKRGALSGNRFKITVRDWHGDQAKTEQQLEAIKAHGIANYYGLQRFGHDGHNVNKALAMFQGVKVGREQHSLYLSAARSFLFNQILAARVADASWDQALPDTVYMIDGSHSSFKSEHPDAEIVGRLAEQSIHPTAVLCGIAKPAYNLNAVEQAVIDSYPALVQGLIACGVEMDRRALRINVADLHWQFVSNTLLVLEFTLPAGCYATALLREIIVFK